MASWLFDCSVESGMLPIWSHRDPFDRLLVTQAISTPLTLVSADAALIPYGAQLHSCQ